MSLNAVLSLLFLFSVCNYVICVWIWVELLSGFFKDTFMIGCQKFTEISIPSQDLCLLVTYIEKVEKVNSDIKVEMI